LERWAAQKVQQLTKAPIEEEKLNATMAKILGTLARVPMKTTTITIALLFALALSACSPAPDSQAYDLVILTGRVMDPETMLDAAMNVGVKDGTIAIITKDTITGKEAGMRAGTPIRYPVESKGRVVPLDK